MVAAIEFGIPKILRKLWVLFFGHNKKDSFIVFIVRHMIAPSHVTPMLSPYYMYQTFFSSTNPATAPAPPKRSCLRSMAGVGLSEGDAAARQVPPWGSLTQGKIKTILETTSSGVPAGVSGFPVSCLFCCCRCCCWKNSCFFTDTHFLTGCILLLSLASPAVPRRPSPGFCSNTGGEWSGGERNEKGDEGGGGGIRVLFSYIFWI